MKPSLLRKLTACGLVTAFFATSSSSAQEAELTGLRGMKILFVVGETDKDHPSDDALVEQHLEALGAVVARADSHASSAAADGKDLIVISATADAHGLGTTYRDVPVPVFTWNAYAYQYLSMTGDQVHTDFEVVDGAHFAARTMSDLYPFCTNATHPIARAVGLPSQVFGSYYLQSTESCWGRPGLGAQTLAIFEGDPNKAAVFTYERGATMIDNGVAPARRVGFYLGHDNFHLLSDIHGPYANDPDQRTWWIGRKLFDAALRWAVSPPPAPVKYDPAGLRAALARAAKGVKLLFVCRLPTEEGQETDAHMIEHLRSLGFDLTVADGEDPDTRANGQDFVLLSSTLSKFKLTNKYRNVHVPLLCLESLMADTYRMTGRRRYIEYGMHGETGESDDPPESYVRIVSAWHPLAAGLASGMHQFVKEPDLIKWAIPTRSAIVVATVGNSPDQPAIFGYEKGSTLADDSLAPARRMMFGLDNPQFDDLTDDGVLLFDSAVLWCITKPQE